tara:strand:+ start:1830 stop:2171 length:342 start_codon:yes stop_codon:yes gene_type:complete
MNTYKITHKEWTASGGWRIVYSIRKAQTKQEAIQKLDRHKSLIKSIQVLRTQEPSISIKQTYEKCWLAWNDKIERKKIANTSAISEILSPSIAKQRKKVKSLSHLLNQKNKIK